MLTVCSDEHAVAAEAAEWLTARIEAVIAARGGAIVSLTGGTTPGRLYELLGDSSHPWRSRIDWPRLYLFWGDERHVPPDHADSNFGMARDALLRHVPVPDSQIHRMRGELLDAHDAARDYDRALREGFAAAGRSDLTFDLMLLGLGEDAHIASIFPGSELIDRKSEPSPKRVARRRAGSPREPEGFAPRTQARVAAVWAPHLNAWRITLTPLALLDARVIMMVVAGAKKADAVHAALEAPLDVSRYPAQLLREAGERVEWFVNRAAAARLSPPNE